MIYFLDFLNIKKWVTIKVKNNKVTDSVTSYTFSETHMCDTTRFEK